MKLVIIGGSGFIGSYLVNSLIKFGVDFKTLDVVESKIYSDKWQFCDVTDISSLSNDTHSITS